jgi:hypothetical protein
MLLGEQKDQVVVVTVDKMMNGIVVEAEPVSGHLLAQVPLVDVVRVLFGGGERVVVIRAQQLQGAGLEPLRAGYKRLAEVIETVVAQPIAA